MELDEWVPPACRGLNLLSSSFRHLHDLRRDVRDGNVPFDYEELGPLREHALDLTLRFVSATFKNPSFRHSLFVSQKLQVAPFYLTYQPLFTVLYTSIPVHVSSPRRRRSCAVRPPSQEGTSSSGYVAQHNTGGDHARMRSTVGTAHAHILPVSPSSSLWSALGTRWLVSLPREPCPCRFHSEPYPLHEAFYCSIIGFSFAYCALSILPAAFLRGHVLFSPSFRGVFIYILTRLSFLSAVQRVICFIQEKRIHA